MNATDTDALTERIARALYVESCEEEDGGLTWETEESVAEEIEGWERFAAAVLPIVEAEVRDAKAEALRDAARYFAGGLHCADMRTTPEETVRYLNRRATEYETGDQT